MSNSTKVEYIGDFVARVGYPEVSEPPKLLVMLHGWTGDENSMWIFSPRIPKYYLIIAPRGITRTPLGGYGWQESALDGWSTVSDFELAIEKLLNLIDSAESFGVDPLYFDLMGFSQGAALAFAITFAYPERVDKVAGLSGFLPGGLESKIGDSVLEGKRIFVAHGRQDELVPIAKGRAVVEGLKTAGAQVSYCEEDVGHKLSSGCFHGLNGYFSRE
jgi:phospholipase/carboxylesterase